MVVPSVCSWRKSSNDSCPVFASSSPVGSSAKRSPGRFASARAMATRCCSPPESCAGQWRSRAAETHVGQQLSARALRSAPRTPASASGSSMFSRAVSVGEEIEALKHEANVLQPEQRRSRSGSAPTSRPRKRTVPAVGSVDDSEDVEQRRFATPGRSDDGHILVGPMSSDKPRNARTTSSSHPVFASKVAHLDDHTVGLMVIVHGRGGRCPHHRVCRARRSDHAIASRRSVAAIGSADARHAGICPRARPRSREGPAPATPPRAGRERSGMRLADPGNPRGWR